MENTAILEFENIAIPLEDAADDLVLLLDQEDYPEDTEKELRFLANSLLLTAQLIRSVAKHGEIIIK